MAERWRSERLDSLMFQFPNWTIRLAGHTYQTADPEGFAPRDEVVRFIESYATRIAAPVRCGIGTPGESGDAIRHRPYQRRRAAKVSGSIESRRWQNLIRS